MKVPKKKYLLSNFYEKIDISLVDAYYCANPIEEVKEETIKITDRLRGKDADRRVM